MLRKIKLTLLLFFFINFSIFIHSMNKNNQKNEYTCLDKTFKTIDTISTRCEKLTILFCNTLCCFITIGAIVILVGIFIENINVIEDFTDFLKKIDQYNKTKNQLVLCPTIDQVCYSVNNIISCNLPFFRKLACFIANYKK